MAASPPADHGIPSEGKWAGADDQHSSDGPTHAQTNGNGNDATERPAESEKADYSRGNGENEDPPDEKGGSPYREHGDRQAKPNKVYIGGLPEHTRREDLQSCFGKIGNIVNIELKVGYGFVEFETREAAEESVAKYNEGYFMGNKIRVEISHGGRTAKYQSEPGACFKCGQLGHWARECPNSGPPSRRGPHGAGGDPPLIDRIHPARDYPPAPPPRDYPPYARDEYPRYPPRDRAFGGYDYPPPPGRDLRRPPSPPYRGPSRDYPPPPPRVGRDYDDYRMRGPPPPPVPVPAGRFGPGYVPPPFPPDDYPPPRAGYGGPPPVREPYDRYDRRGPPPPPVDRYSGYPPPVRSRTPPGVPPPRIRDDFDRPGPPRDYPPGGPPEFRGRPITPPPARYGDYPPPRTASPTGSARYRRRSQSPLPRSSSGAIPFDGPYPPPPGERFGNGYAGGPGGPPPMPPRGGSRDYPPRGVGEPGGYRRP